MREKGGGVSIGCIGPYSSPEPQTRILLLVYLRSASSAQAALDERYERWWWCDGGPVVHRAERASGERWQHRSILASTRMSNV